MQPLTRSTQRLATGLGLGLIASLALSTTVAAAPLGAKDEPIKLAIHEWTGQHITSHIAGHILERMGYTVDYVTAGYLGAGTAVSDGNLSATLEVWDNNLGEFYPKLLKDGKLEDIGDVGLDAGEGWIYPMHVAQKCPGLPDWKAFLGCSKLFATAETFPKGRFLEYPGDWGDRATQLIKGEGLDFAAIPAGSEGALVAELNASVETKAPLVMMFWTPHWVLAGVDVGWVDIPAELLTKYGLAKPRVFKIVWPGTKAQWPAAYELMKNLHVTNEIQKPLMVEIDHEGKDAVAVTKAWVEANEALWQPWVAKALQ